MVSNLQSSESSFLQYHILSFRAFLGSNKLFVSLSILAGDSTGTKKGNLSALVRLAVCIPSLLRDTLLE